MTFDNKNKPTGIKRVYLASLNSAKAFQWLLANESAFKQEILLLIILTPVTFWLDVSRLEQLMLVLSIIFIIFAEVVNTAIEAVVDRISLDFNLLSGLAKDLGSAAVLISLIVALLTWGVILWPG